MLERLLDELAVCDGSAEETPLLAVQLATAVHDRDQEATGVR
jgi:hypothetical protein